MNENNLWNVKIGMEHIAHSYILYMKYYCRSTITKIETVRIIVFIPA
jgi:hypothetical protein